MQGQKNMCKKTRKTGTRQSLMAGPNIERCPHVILGNNLGTWETSREHYENMLGTH
jgi:hypothetical protein